VRKRSTSDTVRAFADSLPNPSSLKAQPEEFWNRLRVWHERVLEERVRDPDHVGRRLRGLGKGLLQSLCLWVGLPIEGATVTKLASSLHGAASKDPPPIWFQDLFLLLELLKGKSPEAIETVARAMLPEAVVSLIEGGAFTANGRRMAYAMKVYHSEPADLSLLVMFAEAERVGYTRYTLALADEGGAASLAEAERIKKGMDLTSLTVPVVERALAAPGRKRSQCARVMHEKGGSAVVFLYHMLREASIPQIDRTLFGDEVETVVLRFKDRIRFVEERSTSRSGAAIAGAIASHLLNAKVKYVDETGSSTQQALDKLLTTLANDGDERLRLVEINLRQAPLAGAPTLILRCDKSASLAVTVRALEARQIPLLEELEDVEQLGLAMDHVTGGKRRPYIFRLQFEAVDGSYVVRYSCGRVPSQLRTQFEVHLEERYDVRVIPAA
jgi:hypothetical protein